MRSAFFHFAIPSLCLAACTSGSNASTGTSTNSSAFTSTIELRAVDVVDADDSLVPDLRQIVISISRVDVRLVDETDDDAAAWTARTTS